MDKQKFPKNLKVFVLGFGRKKKKILEGYYDFESLMRISGKIEKCNLIIIKADKWIRDDALEMLRVYSCKNRCYAPIVSSDRTDVLFFPQLRYQDSYLLSYLLRQQHNDERYFITYAGSCQLVN